MYFSVDRIEGLIAVLLGEDDKPLEVPVTMLPAGTKNGDMLWYENKRFVKDENKTAERRERVATMLGMLLKED